jgi:AraC-like DNA-binding protein
VTAVAVLLGGGDGVAALRRSLPRVGPKVAACRNIAALRRALATRLVDAVVMAPGALPKDELAALRRDYPALPLIAYGAFRPDDGPVLRAAAGTLAAVVVEGVDDPVLGDLVLRHSLTAVRRRALAAAPRLLSLEDELQRRAWLLAVERVAVPWRTEALARALRVSREHLSRQFGAGGAPNIKRVIDLCRVAAAAQLLANPGYSVADAARLLRFASPSHLGGTARRIAGVGAAELVGMSPAEILRQFVRLGRTRSRV